MINKLYSLQYLRAIAALFVVYSHAISFIGNGNSSQSNFYYLKSFGAIGVDIFFVISGFIIAYISKDFIGKSDAKEFLIKRVIRINPSYYLISIIALILRYCSKPDTEFPLNEVLKTFTILPIFDYGEKFWKPILYVGWTLAFEWFFYLFFAILIFFKIKKKNIIIIITFFILVLIGIIFPIDNIQYKFITNPLVLEFCLGILIAIIFEKKIINIRVTIIFLITSLLFFALIIFKGLGINAHNNSDLNNLFYGYRFLFWGIPSSFLVIGMIFIEKNYVKFNNKIILLLGDASFSIYLIHTVVLSFFNKFYYKFNSVPEDILIIIYIILSTIISILYYRNIESKISYYLLKKLKKS